MQNVLHFKLVQQNFTFQSYKNIYCILPNISTPSFWDQGNILHKMYHLSFKALRFDVYLISYTLMTGKAFIACFPQKNTARFCILTDYINSNTAGQALHLMLILGGLQYVSMVLHYWLPFEGIE